MRFGEFRQRRCVVDPMSDPATYGQRLVKRHLQLGWWLILGFLTLSIGLEWLNAAKVPWYINEAVESRRQLWTLAHAHGVLLGLLHVAFAATMDSHPDKMLRAPEVMMRVGLSRTTIWRHIRAGIFPAPIEIGVNSIGWPENSIAEWIESRPRRTYGAQAETAA